MLEGVSLTLFTLPFSISSLISEYLTCFVRETFWVLIILPSPLPSPTKDLKIRMITIENIANANSGLSLKKLLLLLLS